MTTTRGYGFHNHWSPVPDGGLGGDPEGMNDPRWWQPLVNDDPGMVVRVLPRWAEGTLHLVAITQRGFTDPLDPFHRPTQRPALEVLVTRLVCEGEGWKDLYFQRWHAPIGYDREDWEEDEGMIWAANVQPLIDDFAGWLRSHRETVEEEQG